MTGGGCKKADSAVWGQGKGRGQLGGTRIKLLRHSLAQRERWKKEIRMARAEGEVGAWVRLQDTQINANDTKCRCKAELLGPWGVGAGYQSHVPLTEERGRLCPTATLWLRRPRLEKPWLERELPMLDRAALTHRDGGWSLLPGSTLREDGGVMTWSMWRPLLFSHLAILTWWAFLEVWGNGWQSPHYIVGRRCPTWSPKSCELGSYSSPYVRIVLLFFLLLLIVCIWGRVAHTHDTVHMWRVKGILWEPIFSYQVSPRDWIQVARLAASTLTCWAVLPALKSVLNVAAVSFRVACRIHHLYTSWEESTTLGVPLKVFTVSLLLVYTTWYIHVNNIMKYILLLYLYI